MQTAAVAKRAAEARRLEGGWGYGEFAQILEELRAGEAAKEAGASRLITPGRRAFAVGFALLALGTTIGELLDWGERAYWVLLITALSCIGGGILIAVRLYRQDKSALPPGILEAVGETVRLIRGDLYPGGRVWARVDLSKDRRAWLELRFRLRDKYHVTLRQMDALQVTMRTSTSASGKEKTKPRYRRLCRVTVTVRPPSPVRWSLAAKVDAKWERLRIKPGRQGDRLVFDRWFTYKYKPEAGQQTVSGRELVEVLLRACSSRPASGG